MKISVVIPTFSNKNFIGNLINNIKYLENCQIIVVNDNPKRRLNDPIFKSKNISLIENQQNLGFSKSVNIGISKATGNYVMLLNDDVLLSDTSFLNLIEQFENNKNLLAISYAQIDNDGKISGKNRLFWENGFIQHSTDSNITSGNTGWAEAGSSLYDKSKLIKLHGFDEIFSPFYWEDIDLSYRGKKMGYEILFEKKVLVKHHHETTIANEFTKSRISEIAYRNQLIFIWKNIYSTSLIFGHLMALFKILIISLLKNDIVFYKGFFGALLRLPKIMLIRKKTKYILSDYEILKK